MWLKKVKKTKGIWKIDQHKRAICQDCLEVAASAKVLALNNKPPFVQ